MSRKARSLYDIHGLTEPSEFHKESTNDSANITVVTRPYSVVFRC